LSDFRPTVGLFHDINTSAHRDELDASVQPAPTYAQLDEEGYLEEYPFRDQWLESIEKRRRKSVEGERLSFHSLSISRRSHEEVVS